MAKKKTLWPITRATQAKHTILRKYLDAWLPILGAGRYAHAHLVLIDGFAGPGRYSGGEPGSPLIMLSAYLEHSANFDAAAHFFIEEDRARCAHLRSEIGKPTLLANVQVEIIEGSFVDEFPQLLERLTTRFGQLPPTFAFIAIPSAPRRSLPRSRRGSSTSRAARFSSTSPSVPRPLCRAAGRAGGRMRRPDPARGGARARGSTTPAMAEWSLRADRSLRGCDDRRSRAGAVPCRSQRRLRALRADGRYRAARVASLARVSGPARSHFRRDRRRF